MKKLINLSWLVLILSGCASVPNAILPYQKSLNVQVNSINIENTLQAKDQIDAEEYVFPFNVENIEVDSVEMKALVFIRDPKEKAHKTPGLLIFYDLVEDEIIWVKRSYAWDPRFFADKIIIQGKGKVFALNKKTGDMIWERPGSYFLYSKENNIGFSGSLNAFDLETGKNLWSREVSNKFGWNDHEIRDSVIIVAMDGLHSFNLETGNGWDIEMSTGRTNEGGAFAASVALGALFGSSASNVKASIWTNMTSNLLFDKDKIFFSAKDDLVSIDIETGKEIWRTTFPDKKTAETILHDDGDYLVVLNRGSCDKNSISIKYGEPFIAKFNQTTGEQSFFDFIDSESPVKDLFVSSDGYYIISSETLAHYGIDGKVKAKVKFDKDEAVEKYGDFLFFSDESGIFEDNYVKVNENFELLSNYFNHNNMPLAITNKGIIIFKENFEIDHWFEIEQIYYSPFELANPEIHRSYVFMKYKPTIDHLSQMILIYQESKYRRIRKTYQKQYDEIVEGRSEFLTHMYLIEEGGDYKGNFKMENLVFRMKNKLYYRSGNSLVLFSPEL